MIERRKTEGIERIVTRRPNGTVRVQTKNVMPSRTQKQYKDEVNVNNIIKKYRQTGSITHVRNAQNGVYADLTNLPDLMEAQAVIIAAEAAFAEVPAKIRQRFQHDPRQMIDFLSDPNNQEEAIKLGLMVRQKEKPADPVLTELQNLNKNLSDKKSAAAKKES